MDITQTFYDSLATQYDKLFLDWQAASADTGHSGDQCCRKKEHKIDSTGGDGGHILYSGKPQNQ